MKINRILACSSIAASVLVSGLSLSSCTGNFEELNTNPYQVDPANLPTTSQFVEPMTYVYAPQQNLFQFWTNLSIDLYGGYFMTPHNFSGNGNADYKLNRGFNGGMYENYYLHIFNNTSRLIKQYDEMGQADFAAVMRVIQAYATACATDAYGPIPYSSVIVSNGVSFAYDKQQDIYNAIFQLLDDAVSGFKSSSAKPGEWNDFDYWCGGDMQLWVKVANTFKLRYAMRIVKADPALARQKAEEAVAGGVLTNADRDILIDKGVSNELRRMFDWGDCGMNASLVTIMQGYNDPRMPLFMTKNINDVNKYKENKEDPDELVVAKGMEYIGIRGGSELPNKPNPWSNYSGIVCDYNTPLPVLKVAEAYFLRAEGALRGWNMGGSAKDLYNQGIRVSIQNELKYKAPFVKGEPVTITDAQIDAYINGTTMPIDYVDPANAINNIAAMNLVPVKFADGESNEYKLQQIITQKWIANFPLSTEAWAEYRRTGYPKLFPNRVNKSEGTIDTDEQVRRLIYSGVEQNTNAAELDKGIQLLDQESSSTFKGDIGGTRVWWDRANKGNF